jgi:hypothetical protein
LDCRHTRTSRTGEAIALPRRKMIRLSGSQLVGEKPATKGSTSPEARPAIFYALDLLPAMDPSYLDFYGAACNFESSVGNAGTSYRIGHSGQDRSEPHGPGQHLQKPLCAPRHAPFW